MFASKFDAYRVYMGMRAADAAFRSMIYILLAVYYVQTVGMNPLQLVLVGTVLEATCFLFEIPTGVVADVYSRRLSVIIGFTLVGICFIGEGLLPLFGAILLAEVVRGVGETFISGAEDAWIADELGEERLAHVYLRGGPLYSAWLNQNLNPKVRATVLSFSSQVDALGQAAGGPAVGAVGNGFGLRAALTLAGVLLMPVSLLYGRATRRSSEQAKVDEESLAVVAVIESRSELMPDQGDAHARY